MITLVARMNLEHNVHRALITGAVWSGFRCQTGEPSLYNVRVLLE
jgi:hypothetical protein